MPHRVNVLLKMAAVLSIPFLFTACACKPQNPSFPVTFSQAGKAVDDMRAQPRQLSRPLVIIGGFGDPNVSPPLFKNFFQSICRDSQIITVSVGLCQSFHECRQKVIEEIDKALPTTDPDFTAEVDVVGASLGGLVARYVAAPSDDPAHPRRLKIARLFSISSPHTGARLAQLIAFTAYHRDLRPNSAFLERLAEHDGDATYELYPYVRLHDELVGANHADDGASGSNHRRANPGRHREAIAGRRTIHAVPGHAAPGSWGHLTARIFRQFRRCLFVAGATYKFV
jgi:hypothetical protein